MKRHLAAATGILAAMLLIVTAPVVAAPAHAATITCAPDPFEVDDLGQNVTATIAVGGTASRALCQTRTILPGKPMVQDVDYFTFTATEGQSYTVEAVAVGSDLVNNADRGGLSVGISAIHPDGTVSGVEQQTAPNGDRSTTTPLHAGTYLVGAADGDLQVYPEDNVITTKTIQGDAGKYTIRLTATAPPPVAKSVVVTPNPVKGGDTATAKVTFTGPLLAGGSYVPVSSSDGFVAAPGGSQVAPAGVTTWSVTVPTRRVSKDTPVTISSWVSGAGPTVTTTLTVRK